MDYTMIILFLVIFAGFAVMSLVCNFLEKKFPYKKKMNRRIVNKESKL